MRTKRHETIYLDRDQSGELVSRIAERCLQFDYHMSAPEMEAMADLLSDIGVNVSDIIDVSNLADNYAINAEIVTPDDYNNYSMKNVKDDSLFSWKENDGTHYCLAW